MSKNTMVSAASPSQKSIPKTEAEWKAFSVVLTAYINNCLSKYNIPHWFGSEKQLVEDVRDETLARVLYYAWKAEQDLVPPINSFEALCKITARNYLLDLRRRDKHIAMSIESICLSNEHQYIGMSEDIALTVIEDMMMYEKMLLIAKVVKGFSTKLRVAVLTHFANLEDFDDEQPRPLERAMWAVGIPLREYRCDLPENPVLRRRHAALVCLGLKSLRQKLWCSSRQPDNAA